MMVDAHAFTGHRAFANDGDDDFPWDDGTLLWIDGKNRLDSIPLIQVMHLRDLLLIQLYRTKS